MRDQVSKKDFAEFYILSALSPQIERSTNANCKKLISYRNNLVLSIADYYLDDLQGACIDEAMCDHSRSWPKKTQPQRLAKLHEAGITSNKVITESFLKRNPDSLIALFEYMRWEDYTGGVAWANVARVYKELLLARKSFGNFDETNFDADRGYDHYTHGSISAIRNHMYGNNNSIQKIMLAIDKVHELESGSRSAFDRFYFSAEAWFPRLMNEKSVGGSVQLLREYAGPEVKQIIEELKVIDVSSAELERQLGQVILSKAREQWLKKLKQDRETEIELVDNNYFFNEVSPSQYEAEKKMVADAFSQASDDIHFYIDALSSRSGNVKERRCILREIIRLSQKDTRFTDGDNALLGSVQDLLISDYDTYEMLVSASNWHNELIKYLAPYYFKIPYKWSSQFTDFVYSKFDQIIEEKELSVAMIATLYDNLKIDGYNMDKFERPMCGTKPKPVPQFNIKEFVEKNFGKEITGTPEWFNEYVNTQSSFYSVSKYMPIGTIVGYKMPNKVCFTPSDHWKSNGYVGHNMNFEYCGTGKKPQVRDVAVEHIEIYDTNKLIQYGGPKNYKDFAYIYAGHKIKINSLITYRWKLNEPIGIIVGYAATKEHKGYIYYVPTPEFEEEGYGGAWVDPSEIVCTLDNVDFDAANLRKIKFDEVSIYTDPENKVVDVHDVPGKPMPPKGSVDGDHFAVKYAGKQIKATYKFAHYLSAISPWDYTKPIGTIVGVNDAKQICFVPSQEFQASGRYGIINFGNFKSVANDIECNSYYTIDYANIELMSPKDYEDQNEGVFIINDGLTPNQKFAMENIGHNIIGKGQVWTRFLKYDCVIGKIVGYKGSLICYTPSKELIEAGYEGQIIDDMIYTDIEYLGSKCYTLISAESIRFQGKNALDEFCYTNYGKRIKATGGLWADLVNDEGENWNLDWPLGDIVGHHKIHNCVCFTPSKQLLAFGWNKGNSNYIGVDNLAKSSAPYYQLFDLTDIELIKPKEKSKKLEDGERYAKNHVGRNVKRSIHTDGWDKTKIVGKIVGYKSSGSIIWVPTAEYADKHPPSPAPEDAIILDKDFKADTLVHSCWHTSLELVADETKGTGFVKQASGGWQWGHASKRSQVPFTGHHMTPHHHMSQATATTVNHQPKKKKKVKDRPWDKPLNIEPLDMPPYIETNE